MTTVKMSRSLLSALRNSGNTGECGQDSHQGKPPASLELQTLDKTWTRVDTDNEPWSQTREPGGGICSTGIADLEG